MRHQIGYRYRSGNRYIGTLDVGDYQQTLALESLGAHGNPLYSIVAARKCCDKWNALQNTYVYFLIEN
jgi:hypothetical protein